MDYLVVKEMTEYNGLSVFPLAMVSPAFETKDSFRIIGNEEEDETGEKGGGICVIETGDMGSVRIVSRGDTPTLALDGLILIGGAANRMLTASAVIRKNEVVNLPVVSVEASRWDCVTFPTGMTQITASEVTFTGTTFAPSSIRRARLEKSILAMKKKGVSIVDQDMVWKQIKALFEKSSIEMLNLDVCELYNHWNYLLDEYSSKFALVEMQVGCIVFTDRNTWYLDVFCNSSVFSDLFPNLLKSYAMEVIMARIGLEEEDHYHWVPELADAQDAFAKIKLIKFHTLQATGREGEEIAFFASRKACGTALTDGPALMHMSACSRRIGEETNGLRKMRL